MKFRIIKVHKPGYYSYYEVQQRFMLFFWFNHQECFDTTIQAEKYIADQFVVETKEVVK